MTNRNRLSPRPRVTTRLTYRKWAVGVGITTLLALGAYAYLQLGQSQASLAAGAPVSIGGVINTYARVTALNPATRQLKLSNLSGPGANFNAGTKVLLIQMKGATVSTANDTSFGRVTALGSAGHYELSTVLSRSGTTITLDGLLRSYQVSGAVQVVSVPQYERATVTSTLTALAWDSAQGRGGVLALEVTGTLRLEAGLDVSGQGFRGGTPNTTANGGNADNVTFVTAQSTGYARKGEGVAWLPVGQTWGRGTLANGGGGGNTHNAGGGGGSNYTRGGNGGRSPSWAGNGGEGIRGRALPYSAAQNRLFMGGGGGGGQQNNNKGSAGAAGGGIIIVRAGTLTRDCNTPAALLANGNTAPDTRGPNGNDGAGGGGGGGVVWMEVGAYSLTCDLIVATNGGNGGNVDNGSTHGGGGPGGVGAILRANAQAPPQLIAQQQPGTGGASNRGAPINGSSGQGGEPVPPGGGFTGETGWQMEGNIATLPVELLFFRAQPQGERVEVSWATASELNNSHFVVERSADGTRFQPLAQPAGAGNSQRRLDYRYADEQPLPGTSYYRLSQVDFDGAGETFAAVAVRRVAGGTLRLSRVSPNPFTHQVRISYQAPAAGQAQVEFIDLRAQTLHRAAFAAVAGGGEQLLTDLDGLPAGAYLLRLSVEGQSAPPQRVIKQ